MTKSVSCPSCGRSNPSEREFCQYCRSPLTPASGQPLTPGQAPTPKSTSEFEPVLPQWIKDARDAAKRSSQEEEPQPSVAPQARPSAFLGGDLLAGLQSQSQEEEEDIPDWLADITGQPKKPKTPKPESSEVRWVGVDGSKEFTQPIPKTKSPSESSTPIEGKRETAPDWLADAEQVQAQKSPQPFTLDSSSSVEAENPDWLRSFVSEGEAVFDDSSGGSEELFPPADTPDWLRGLETLDSSAELKSAPAFSETPDWLKTTEAEKAAPSADADTPDWLKTTEAEKAAPSTDADTPDWLKAMEAEKAAPSTEAELPDWLKTTDAVPSAFVFTSGPESAAADSPPDWLKNLEPAAEDDLFKDVPPSPQQPLAAETGATDEEDGLPSWLKAAAPQSSVFAEPAETPPAPSFPETHSKGEESLFTELPDWLSIVDETIASETAPTPITNADAIAPGELPSWVQAMRPVDAAAPLTAAAAMSADKTLETQGALAGLQGVLPAAPASSPVRKPKALSLRLNASEEQRSHAALLEQILAAETSPLPMDAPSRQTASRALRWFLTLIFFAVIPALLLMRTTFFPLPNSVYVPLEINGALSAIQSIPDDAAVLAVFDYEPARAGEMESVATPIFDQLMLRGIRLTLVSSNETGMILAERLISSGYLAGHENAQYVNLGYLPGGQMGIRAFADNPSGNAPYAFAQKSLFDFTPVAAWETPALQGVTSLNQFAAILLLTDNADSARVWIEQTQSARGAAPVTAISSTQAAPALQPYFASGQIRGIFSGLHGGALFEQYNANKPGTARLYWDSYSAGLLLAILLLTGGGLLNLALGLRSRAQRKEGD